MRIISLPDNFVDLRRAPIDIHEIEGNIRDFYNALDIDENEDIKTQCLDARSYLDSARVSVRNLISIEENDYIKNYPKAYIFMQENLGRVDKRINSVEVDNVDQLFIHEKYQGGQITESPLLRRYINSLLSLMEHLVYQPLKKALKKYDKVEMDESGKKIIKNENLFLYFVFLELLHSSESIGSVTAESKSSSKGNSITSNPVAGNKPSEYNSQEDAPSSLPEHIEIEELTSDIESRAEEFFSDSLEETEKETPRETGEDILFEDDEIQITEEDENESS